MLQTEINYKETEMLMTLIRSLYLYTCNELPSYTPQICAIIMC